MAKRDAYNPITSLMDVDLPEIKRANWNCDHTIQLTSDVLYAKPIFSDYILPHTRVQLDIDQSSFANPTLSPLYGRYKVKYLAFFAPHRLYMREWRMNKTYNLNSITSIDDNKKLQYPTLNIPSFVALNNLPPQYVPPTSLAEYLGVYPAYFQNSDWSVNDRPDNSTAFSFLTFWDCYRYYIANQQETSFPVRTKAFRPSFTNENNVVVQSQPFEDTMVSLTSLNLFFDQVINTSTTTATDVIRIFQSNCGFDPIFATKEVSARPPAPGSIIPQYFVQHEYHYGLPIAPFTPDPLTSWLDNDNVELEFSSTKMTVENGQISMDQWRIANALQQKMRKYLYNFGDFGDMIDAQYGIRPSTQISKPMFLGMFQSDIVFNDVVSTAQTGDDGIVESNQVLGSRAGYGHGTDRGKENWIDFTAEEFGTFQIIQIIIPEVFYYEGRDLMYLTHSYEEEFNSTQNIGILQDLEKQQLNLVPNRTSSPTGTSNGGQTPFSLYNTSIGKQPYGMQHICKTNRLLGMFTMDEYYKGWTLARSFNGGRNVTGFPLHSQSYSSYGIPEMFNIQFANTQNIDNFQFYINFNYTKYNVVLKKFIPFT